MPTIENEINLRRTINQRNSNLQGSKGLDIRISSMNILDYCDKLLASRAHPNTKEYSYQLISTENFRELFYEAWKILVFHNRKLKRIRTFTLRFLSDSCIVLQYSAGKDIQKFLLLTLPLVQFLIKLHNEHNIIAQNKIKTCNDNESVQRRRLIVRIDKNLIPPNVIRNVVESIDNPYGISYGPSVQRLIEFCLVPQLKNPLNIQGPAVHVNIVEISAICNVKSRRFVRRNEKEHIFDEKYSTDELADEPTDLHVIARIENQRKKGRREKAALYSSNVSRNRGLATPRTMKTEFEQCPIEADVANCVEPTLPQHKTTLYEKYAIANDQVKDSIDDGNRLNILNQCIENLHGDIPSINSDQELPPAKIVRKNRLKSRRQESNVIDICCGLDSRYCKCYRLDGYIPEGPDFEIIKLGFIPIDDKSLRIIIGKCTYDPTYADIYKTGDLKTSHIAKNKFKRITLGDFAEQYDDDIFLSEFAFTMPYDLYIKWADQQRIVIDDDIESMTLIKVDTGALGYLSILNPVYTDFNEIELERIFAKMFICVEDSDLSVVSSPRRDNTSKGIEDVANVKAYSDVAFSKQKPFSSPILAANEYLKGKQIPSIKSEIPFTIICLADIKSKITTYPPVTSDFLFKHGFETSVEADYEIRRKHLKTKWKDSKLNYEVQILNDLTVCMLLKDDTDVDNQRAQGLDFEYIKQVDSLFRDTLEWSREAVENVALPFYFKKLQASYLKAENEFPSTQVAKTKIENLMKEYMAQNRKTKISNIPVLWINSKVLELSTIRHRLTNDNIFFLFKKHTHLKYSLESVYLPNPTSPITYKKKYGTFNTLPMELQQTSQVFFKLSEYPKPFLVFISDAYAFDSKKVKESIRRRASQIGNEEQCNTNEEYDEKGIRANTRKPPNFYNENINVKKAVRVGAKKPPNFYNEDISRISGLSNQFQLTDSQDIVHFDRNNYGISEPPPKQLSQPAGTHPPINDEEDFENMQVGESQEFDTADNVLIESEDQNNALENNHLIASKDQKIEKENTDNSNNRDTSIDQAHSREKIQIISIQKSTLVRTSLPLQKKYSMIQERNRELRRNNDQMFLKSNHIHTFKAGQKSKFPHTKQKSVYNKEKHGGNAKKIKIFDKESNIQGSKQNATASGTQLLHVSPQNIISNLRPEQKFIEKPLEEVGSKNLSKITAAKTAESTAQAIDENNKSNSDLMKNAKQSQYSEVNHATKATLNVRKHSFFVRPNLKAAKRMIENPLEEVKTKRLSTIAAVETTSAQSIDINDRVYSDSIQIAPHSKNNQSSTPIFDVPKHSFSVRALLRPEQKPKKPAEAKHMLTIAAAEVANTNLASVDKFTSEPEKSSDHSNHQEENLENGPNREQMIQLNEEYLRSLSIARLMLLYPLLNVSNNNYKETDRIIFEKVLYEKIRQGSVDRKAHIPDIQNGGNNSTDGVYIDIEVTSNEDDHVPKIGPAILRARPITSNKNRSHCEDAAHSPIAKKSKQEINLRPTNPSYTKLAGNQLYVNQVHIEEGIDLSKSDSKSCGIAKSLTLRNDIDKRKEFLSMQNHDITLKNTTLERVNPTTVGPHNSNACLIEQTSNSIRPFSHSINTSEKLILQPTPSFIPAPRSTYTKPAEVFYQDRNDDKGNAVSSEQRCQSIYPYPLTNQIQTLPIQSAVSNFLHVRGLPRMIPPPPHQPSAFTYIQPVQPTPRYQKSSDRLLLVNINQQDARQCQIGVDADIQRRSIAPRPVYLPGSNDGNLLKDWLAKRNFSECQIRHRDPRFLSVNTNSMNGGNYTGFSYGRLPSELPVQRLRPASFAQQQGQSSVSLSPIHFYRLQPLNAESLQNGNFDENRRMMPPSMNYVQVGQSQFHNYNLNHLSSS